MIKIPQHILLSASNADYIFAWQPKYGSKYGAVSSSLAAIGLMRELLQQRVGGRGEAVDALWAGVARRGVPLSPSPGPRHLSPL